MEIMIFLWLAAACGWVLFALAISSASFERDQSKKLLAEKANREAYIRELEQRCGERDPEQDKEVSNG
jgi:adenylylsulfate kinase-like enzyme